jgi:hypothetical protein
MQPQFSQLNQHGNEPEVAGHGSQTEKQHYETND